MRNKHVPKQQQKVRQKIGIVLIFGAESDARDCRTGAPEKCKQGSLAGPLHSRAFDYLEAPRKSKGEERRSADCTRK